MSKRRKILTGIFSLVIGLGVAAPMQASAANDHWWDRHHDKHWEENHRHDTHYHEWWWQKDHDHYRAYSYAPGSAYHPADGEGMRDPRNPNVFWACDSDGHHCHWAER
jgi:hypothetical protein